ncbi:hypothetical protein BGZ72_005625 [Mortierella alpina]|nr:hypothetical protein BGZ72_005625 [Mortierella alpina]
MEFMAIVWLRESSPDEGRIRVPFHSDASGRDRHTATDGRVVRPEESHLQRMQHEQRQRGGYVYTGAGTGAEAVILSGGSVLQARAGTGHVPQVGAGSLSGSDRSKDDKDGAHEQPPQQVQPPPQSHQSQLPQHAGQHQQQQQQQPRSQPLEQDRIPSSSAGPGSGAAVSQLPENAEALARGGSSTTNQPEQEPSSFNKNTMNDSIQKAKVSTNKHRSSRAHEKNQRSGFKSTKERKLAQLIPALDENGVVIEDHFISPRDTDGDGIPDIYVLLRPTANSRYMMDVGLFDEDIAPPSPAPPSVLPVPLASSAPPVPLTPLAIPESSVPLASAAVIPLSEAQVPAAPEAPSVPAREPAPAPELPASAALLSAVVEVANLEPIEASVVPAAAPMVAPVAAPVAAPAEAPIPSTHA